MHAMGLHSALAVKRQRKRREEQKRARERRYSTQSTESGLGESRSSFASPRNSIGSLDRRKRKGRRKINTKITSTDSKVASSVGMLHVGVVFLVLGLFLLGSGLMPDDVDTWQYKSMERVYEFLLASGVCLFIGLLLICINKVITSKEEKDLNDFIERQLTRSKSGHRLVRDSETGCLVSPRPPKSPMPESMEFENELPNGQPHQHCPRSPPPISPRSDLERILEEEISEKDNSTKFENKSLEENNKVMSNGHYYDNVPIYDN